MFSMCLNFVHLLNNQTTIIVQTGSKFVNGEELLNLAPSHVNPDPLLMPFSNELDIFVSQNTKEKIWNIDYIDLAILLRNNVTVPNEKTTSFEIKIIAFFVVEDCCNY
jgi:hypothetical protein